MDDSPIRRRIEFDAETWHALNRLALDSGKRLQDLADEAFRDLLRKRRRPVGLREGLTESLRMIPANEQRFALMRERVEAMKAIWANDVAKYHGDHSPGNPARFRQMAAEAGRNPDDVPMRRLRRSAERGTAEALPRYGRRSSSLSTTDGARSLTPPTSFT